jgi:hypothetical protein
MACSLQQHRRRAASPALQVRKFDGTEQQVTLQRPVRALQSPVSSKLEGGGSGSERIGVIRLTSFNAQAQVGQHACLWLGACMATSWHVFPLSHHSQQPR